MTTPAAPYEPKAPDHDKHGLLDMITFPFREPDWFVKLWWLALLDYVPFFNLIVLRGWRYEVSRRIARGVSPALPEPELLGRFLVNGMFLWTMTFLYAVVPLVIISVSGWGGIFDFFGDLWTLGKIVFSGGDASELGNFVLQELVHSFLVAVLDGFWFVASLPVYRAAMIRYCVTGKVSAFFDFAGALRFLFAFPGAFAKLYFFSFLLTIGLSISGAILALTGIGALVIPLFALPVYYWTTAAEYGHLGRKLIAAEQRSGAQKQSGLRVLVPSVAALLFFGFCSHQAAVTRATRRWRE